MRLLLLWSFAVSFRKTALNSDFIWICYDFIYAGAGADNSDGVNFEHHRNLLSLSSSAESFRKTDLNSDFTYIFYVFLHVYRPRAIPGQEQIIRWGQF